MGSTVLIKIGGSTLGADDTTLSDVAVLQHSGERVVIVHGGGPAITSWMSKLGIRAEFVRGLRVTDAPSLEVATAVLAGVVNKQLVADAAFAGVKPMGISGADGSLMRGHITEADLGFVAGRVEIDTAPIESLLAAGYVPIIAPIAVDAGNARQLLNVNADTAAGAIAMAIGASHLVFLTDVDGILDSSGRVLGKIPAATGESLIGSGVVKGGMIPKLQACIEASQAGV